MPNILTHLNQGGLLLMFITIGVLIIIFLYLIFAFIVFNQVRSLNKLVNIVGSHASLILEFFALLYFLATLSLFVYALVIL